MISSQSQVCVNVLHNSIIVRRRLCFKSSLNGEKVLSGVNKREGKEKGKRRLWQKKKKTSGVGGGRGAAGERGEESGVSKTWKKIRSEVREAKKRERVGEGRRGRGQWLSVKQVGRRH